MITTAQTVQGDTAANYVNTLSIVWPGNNVAGNFLALLICTSNPSTSAVLSVTDTHNTWTKGASFKGTGVTNLSFDYWYVENCAAGVAPTVVITMAVGQFNTISAVGREYSNVKTSTSQDQTTNTIETNFVTSHPTGTTPATTQANELVIAGYAYTNADKTLTETSGGYTTVVNRNNTTQFTGMAYTDKVVSATGTQAATFDSGINALEGIAFIVTVKDATPGSNPAVNQPYMQMNGFFG